MSIQERLIEVKLVKKFVSHCRHQGWTKCEEVMEQDEAVLKPVKMCSYYAPTNWSEWTECNPINCPIIKEE